MWWGQRLLRQQHKACSAMTTDHSSVLRIKSTIFHWCSCTEHCKLLCVIFIYFITWARCSVILINTYGTVVISSSCKISQARALRTLCALRIRRRAHRCHSYVAKHAHQLCHVRR